MPELMTTAERIVNAVVAQLQTVWPETTNGVRVVSEEEMSSDTPWVTVLFDGDETDEVVGESTKVTMSLVIEAHQLGRPGGAHVLQPDGIHLIGLIKQALVANRGYLRGLALVNQTSISSTSLRLPDENQRALGVAVTLSIPYTERYSQIFK